MRRRTLNMESIQAGEPLFRLDQVCRFFGRTQALKAVTLAVRKGECFTLTGPAGSGKTTLLNILAGFDVPSAGDIVLGSTTITSWPPEKRPSCLISQSPALFPHLTAGQNVEFPLRVRGENPARCYDRATELMALLHLPEDCYERNVMACSADERQRVAVARALAYDSAIVLLDEPLSGLDDRQRKNLLRELKELQVKTGKTFVCALQSPQEAMFMSDRVGVLSQGVLEQAGTPAEIYAHPVSRFVASFIGDTNIFPVRVRPQGGWESSVLPRQELQVEPAGRNLSGFLLVRPERLQLVTAKRHCDNELECRLLHTFSLGSRLQCTLVCGRNKQLMLETEASALPALKAGQTLTAGWNKADAIFVTD